MVISRSPAGAVYCFSFHHMEQEGAASSAPDDQTTGEAEVVLDVASGIALVEPGVEQTIVETPDNPVDDTVKEEEVDFNPGDETDIVGSFLGVEVTTGDLIEDVQELDQPSSSRQFLKFTQRVPLLAHHCRLTVVPRHQRPLSRTQQLGKSQLDHLRQHHRGHQGRGVHVEVKTKSTRIIDVSFTKDSNS